MEPDEHHLDDVHRLLVGDPQAVAEFRLDLELVEQAVDLRAAAMHHHGMDAAELQHHHVAREFASEIGIGHGVAAEFHDDDLVVVALQEGQRLGEDAGSIGGGNFGHGR